MCDFTVENGIICPISSWVMIILNLTIYLIILPCSCQIIYIQVKSILQDESKDKNRKELQYVFNTYSRGFYKLSN